jgi:RHS repeat-associated protein
MIEYQIWKGTEAGDPEGGIRDDYGQGGAIKPGYLTEKQVQPSTVATPAIDALGNVLTDDNVVDLNYGSTAEQADGAARIHGIVDPEGRTIGLAYGDSPESLGQSTEIEGPGSRVVNTYYDDGDLLFPLRQGRLRASTTWRTVGGVEQAVTTSTHFYLRGTPGSNSVAPYTFTFWELSGAVNLAATSASQHAEMEWPDDESASPTNQLYKVWPEFWAAWMELHRTSTSSADGDTSTHDTYVDAVGNTIATFSGGRWTVSIPDAEGRVILSGSIPGGVTRSIYDGAGMLLKSVSVPGGPDAEVSVTEYIYDEQGRQARVERDGELVSATGFSLEARGRERAAVDADGNKTITVTDDAGRTVEERWEGAAGGIRRTRYGYDDFGRRDYVQDARGLVTRTEYDAAGRETAVRVKAPGRAELVTRRGYDRHGRLAWTQTPAQFAADPEPIISVNLYETTVDIDSPQYGQLLGAYHEVPWSEYESAGGSFNIAAYEASGKYYERYEYDEQGRRVAEIKPALLSPDAATPVEIVTRTHYTSQGQVAAMVFNADQPTTDASHNVKFMLTYDQLTGERESVIYPSGLVKEMKRLRNEVGSMVKLTETQIGTSSGAPTSLEMDFNSDNICHRVTDGVGNVTQLIYGKDQRLTGRMWTRAGTSEVAVEHHFVYDELERDTSVTTSENGSISRIEQIEYSGPVRRPFRRTTPEGTITYSYDAFGRIRSMSCYGDRIVYDYDTRGRLREVGTGDGQGMQYDYDQHGKPVKIVNSVDGVVESYRYDPLGRLTRQTIERSQDNTVLYEVEYSLGPDGRRLVAAEKRTDEESSTETTRWLYSYDPLSRLTRERRDTDDDGSFEWDREYEYDADGNRIALIDRVQTDASALYEYYAGSQRLHYVKDAGDNAILHEYQWTENGELAAIIHYLAGLPAWEEQYTWGEQGTLTSVAYSGGPNDGLSVQYAYDSRNVLVRRTVLRGPSVESDERYLVDLQNPTGLSQVVAVLDGRSGRVLRINLWGDRLVSHVAYPAGASDPTRVVYHADPIGSVRATSSGTNVGRFDYGAFGDPLTPVSSSMLTAYAFAGQLRDDLTGMQYHRARWLSSSGGHWLSADPVFDFPDNYGHAYAYAGSDPMNNIDNTGLALYAFDGTDNDGYRDQSPEAENGPTNVFILALTYSGEISYQPGVGTNEVWNWGLFNFYGQITGWNGRKRIDAAFADFETYYNHGNGDTDIDIIGFSRGAALAREFANKIYDNYPEAKIRFIGLFDTVASFGVGGDRDDFDYNFAIPPNVEFVYHLTAVDEKRYFFPLMSILPYPGYRSERLVETGLPGVHSDIGGGYKDNQYLSNIALRRMRDMAISKGVPFGDLPPAFEFLHRAYEPYSQRDWHDSDWLFENVYEYLYLNGPYLTPLSLWDWSRGLRPERNIFYVDSPNRPSLAEQRRLLPALPYDPVPGSTLTGFGWYW